MAHASADAALVIQAYRFALDPTPTQARALASHCGAARFAYNWGLALVKERLDIRAAGEQVDVPWTLPALRRHWNRVKAVTAPWWPENSKEAYSSGFQALAQALNNWADSRAGRRNGERVRFPHFKRKGCARDTCRFTTGAIRVEPDRHHVTLPRLGRLKTHESTRKVARRIEQGTARILSATVSRTADRWFVSFTVEVARRIPATPSPTQRHAGTVGVDAGVRYLAVVAAPGDEPQYVANPRAFSRHQRELARAQQKVARRRTGSARMRRARRRVARSHARTANLRRDAMHKLTTQLATTHAGIVVENLNVAGMKAHGPGKRGLNRAVSDAALAELRRQLTYKARWYGCRFMVADRWYPSSKTCSGCGLVKAKLTATESIFVCESCGLRLDRDVNAARNLAGLMSVVAGSGPETRNARGEDVSPGPVRADLNEARTPQSIVDADKTGTAAPQGSAV
jgi:putative transposase